MIKRQTFLSKIEDDEGNMIDFERWSCKRLSTVEANLRKLYKMSLFQRLYKGKGLHVVIYATPDGYDALVFQKTFLFDEI